MLRRPLWLLKAALSSTCALLLVPTALGQQTSANRLAGCLTGEPGNFILGEVPSGNIFLLQGDTSALNAQRNRLVRVTGQQVSRPTGGKEGAFRVHRVEVLADTCTASLPPENPNQVRSVTGKTGPSGAAPIDTSDTRTAGQETPGVQTEAGASQRLGQQTGISKDSQQNQPPDRGKLAPPQWDQVGQSPQSADTKATAAGRAEQKPGQTLGVDAMPSYAEPGQPQGKPASQSGAKSGSPNASQGGKGKTGQSKKGRTETQQNNPQQR